MTEEQYKKLIREAILEIEELFKSQPNIFLTEDDVRCLLFQQLISRIRPIKLDSGDYSSFVHSEVRWYGKGGDMHKRSDIVVIDATNIRVKADGLPLPTKGYGFNNFYAAIEIKLRRVGGESDNVWLKKISKDVNTLLSLRHEAVNAYNPLLIVIAFDKKSEITEKMKHDYPNVEIIYKSNIKDL